MKSPHSEWKREESETQKETGLCNYITFINEIRQNLSVEQSIIKHCKPLHAIIVMWIVKKSLARWKQKLNNMNKNPGISCELSCLGLPCLIFLISHPLSFYYWYYFCKMENILSFSYSKLVMWYLCTIYLGKNQETGKQNQGASHPSYICQSSIGHASQDIWTYPSWCKKGTP